MAIVIGRMMVSRFRARSRFSNWPPQSTLIPGGKFNAVVETLLGFGDETALVPAADVRAHRDLPLVLAAGDDAGAVHYLDVGNLGERHPAAVARRHHDAADSGHVRARLGRVPHGDIEPAIALEHRW